MNQTAATQLPHATLSNAVSSVPSGALKEHGPAGIHIASFPNPWKHPFAALRWIPVRIFGLASLTLILAVVALSLIHI